MSAFFERAVVLWSSAGFLTYGAQLAYDANNYCLAAGLALLVMGCTTFPLFGKED